MPIRLLNISYKVLLRLFLLISFFGGISQVQAQKKLVQVSGLVVTEDSTRTIPYATIEVAQNNRGTIANDEGFFSIPAYEGDTLIFSSMGFKKSKFLVVEQKPGKYTHIAALEGDTLLMAETIVFPWPSDYEEFKQAFLDLDESKELQQAKENLDWDKLVQINKRMAMDGNENQKIALQQQINSYYYAGGQQPFTQFGNPGSATPIPANLLNPIAWGQLIKAIKRGDFKKDRSVITY